MTEKATWVVATMPRISEFYGIAIYMYYREHLPLHFHAMYGENEVLIELENLSIMRGRLPARALGLVIEWAAMHQAELRQTWSRALAHEPLGRIDPLP